MAVFQLWENESVIYTTSVQVKDFCGSIVRERTFLLHELSASLRVTSKRLVLSPETVAKDNALWWEWNDVVEIFLHNQKGWYVMQPECAAVKFRNGDAIFFENNDAMFAYKEDAIALLEIIWFTAACALVKQSVNLGSRPSLPRVVNWTLQPHTELAVEELEAGLAVNPIELNRQDIAQLNVETTALALGGSVGQSVSRKDLYKHTSSSGPPALRPSLASLPRPIAASGDILSDLARCLINQRAIQSFWSNLSIICDEPHLVGTASVLAIRDEALHTPPFDESLYCQIVLENHRYSVAELYDQETADSDKRASRGMKAGAIYGLFTLNPLVPFFASNQARLATPRHKKIEELIPDPKLLFLQDSYSLLAMTQAGTVLPRMRRIILHPVISGTEVYLRVLPAVLTHDAVIPCQVFSFGGNYFLRPICAGISHEQPSYNARKIHRQYYHLRADGSFVDTGTRVEVKGGDIDTHRYKLFKFTCDTRELEYYYIDYATEPGHVF